MNYSISKFRNFLIYSFIFVWSAIFIAGIFTYDGSLYVYSIFSFVFLMLLASGFVFQIGYGYLFFVMMLWLGFWLKLSMHLWLDYPYNESTGLFDYSGKSWDAVLFVASIGALGVIASRALFFLLRFPSSSSLRGRIPSQNGPLLEWYSKWRKGVWSFAIMACIGLAILNASLGVLIIGLAPSTILVWPLNAVISWLIGNGLALGVATLLWWDVIIGRKLHPAIYAIPIEAFSSTLSVISRGLYIFQVIPQLYALYANRSVIKGFNARNISAFSAVIFLLFFVSVPLSNSLRTHFYYGASSTEQQLPSTSERRKKHSYFFDHASSSSTFFGKSMSILYSASNLAERGVEGISRLAIDRWIGLEGAMTLESYPDKSANLLRTAILEKRQIGSDTMYDEISKSVYFGHVNLEKYSFTEIPGCVAFLYYSGSYIVVFAGMFVLASFLIVTEVLFAWAAGNPFLNALWGAGLANTIAQMGVAPRGAIIPLVETAFAILFIAFVQSSYFAKGLMGVRSIFSVKQR